MSDHAITAFVSVLLAIIGVAIIAVLVSKNSLTSGVLGSLGESLSRMICTAVSPITGKSCGGSSLIEDVHSTVTF